MTDTVITLIALDSTKDQYGVQKAAVETARHIPCQLESIVSSEFFRSKRSGIRSEYKFRMFAPVYRGETVLEYQGRRLNVYRTYPDGDYIELYAGSYEGGGTNGT